MPVRARTLRPRGTPNVADKRRDDDAMRKARHPWRALYGTARWQRIRSLQLKTEPLCVMCLRDDVITAATVCDHVEPARHDIGTFFDGPFQSLCANHHNRDKQRAEALGAKSSGDFNSRPLS